MMYVHRTNACQRFADTRFVCAGVCMRQRWQGVSYVAASLHGSRERKRHHCKWLQAEAFMTLSVGCLRALAISFDYMQCAYAR